MTKFAMYRQPQAPAVAPFRRAARLSAYPNCFLQHLTPSRRPAAEGFVSSLTKSNPRRDSVGFAGCAQVLGLLLHRASVSKHSLTFNGVSFSEVDIWN